MLYTFLLASIVATVFGSDSHCYHAQNATSCLADSHCAWSLDDSGDCGYCTDLKYECADEAQFDCRIYCVVTDVPSYAQDVCWNQDNLRCDGQCQDEIDACLADTTCAAFANFTWTLETSYSEDAGCESLSGQEKEQCKDQNQVFLKALQVALTQYCWGDDNAANADSCNLFKAGVLCHASNCNHECNECSVSCQSAFVDCLFDQQCSVAMEWLMDEISSYEDDGEDIFTPYKLNDAKDAYCADTDTDQYCNDYFNTLWTCLVESCFETGCAYSQCNAKFEACYEDTECQDQLNAALTKYPVDQTPGIATTLISYFCETDAELTCDNTNFQELLTCYGGKCCWDSDICAGASSSQLEGCREPDCLEEACVEVNCLPEFRACMGDETCADTFITQIKWSMACEECMDKGMSASECTADTTNNPDNLNCSALEGSGSSMYLQYYCWKNPEKCNEEFTDLLQCVLQKCSDCEDDEDSGENGESDGEDSAAMCACVFGTCWDATEECFFDKNCWILVFGDDSGNYGIDVMLEAVIDDLNPETPLVPTLLDTKIRENYCNDKDCSEKFWNLWYCVWPPIYMGDAYYESEYWHDFSTGCGVSDGLYGEYPQCITNKCLGFVDDCLGDEESQCTLTFTSAREASELDLCDFCRDGDTECEEECITPSEFKAKYLARCGDDGMDCPQDYRNMANCLYRQCGDQEDWLAGSEKPPMTTEEVNGVVVQSGVLALILSVVLVALTL